MDNTEDYVFTCNNEESFFGRSISSAGDVNNDGINDVLIGGYYYDNGRGIANIYFGNNEMQNIEYISQTGYNSSDNYGSSMAGLGDVNGDQVDDFMIGAPYYPANGAAFLYYGSITNYIKEITEHFNIYPNPSSGFFKINSEDYNKIEKIMIYDISGKVIDIYDDINSINFNIDLSDSKSGIYLIQIITENIEECYRLIKE